MRFSTEEELSKFLNNKKSLAKKNKSLFTGNDKPIEMKEKGTLLIKGAEKLSHNQKTVNRKKTKSVKEKKVSKRYTQKQLDCQLIDYIKQQTGIPKMIIGIDPDSKHSGVCEYDASTNKLNPFTLYKSQLEDYLKKQANQYKQEILVVVEHGEANKAIFGSKSVVDRIAKARNRGNFFQVASSEVNVFANKARMVGRQETVGELIKDFCLKHNINCFMLPPVVNRYQILGHFDKGKFPSQKKDLPYFFKIVNQDFSHLKKIDSEMIDAALIAYRTKILIKRNFFN